MLLNSLSRVSVALFFLFQVGPALSWSQKTTTYLDKAPNPCQGGCWYSWIYGPSVPSDLRNALEPLYQKQTALLQENALQQMQAKFQIPFDLLSAAAGATAGASASLDSPSAARTVAESLDQATSVNPANQPLQRTGLRPLDAALNASDTAVAESEDIGSTILKIGALDTQIRQIRSQYGYDSTMGPAVDPPKFSSILSADDLTRAFLVLTGRSTFDNFLAHANQNSIALDKNLVDTGAQLVIANQELSGLAGKISAASNVLTSPNDFDVASSPRAIRIPSDWIQCQCPPTHPHAGLLVNGTRYHSPLLTCDRYN